jgi:hypothetical protein
LRHWPAIISPSCDQGQRHPWPARLPGLIQVRSAAGQGRSSPTRDGTTKSWTDVPCAGRINPRDVSHTGLTGALRCGGIKCAAEPDRGCDPRRRMVPADRPQRPTWRAASPIGHQRPGHCSHTNLPQTLQGLRPHLIHHRCVFRGHIQEPCNTMNRDQAERRPQVYRRHFRVPVQAKRSACLSSSAIGRAPRGDDETSVGSLVSMSNRHATVDGTALNLPSPL